MCCMFFPKIIPFKECCLPSSLCSVRIMVLARAQGMKMKCCIARCRAFAVFELGTLDTCCLDGRCSLHYRIRRMVSVVEENPLATSQPNTQDEDLWQRSHSELTLDPYLLLRSNLNGHSSKGVRYRKRI
jgi:hypothetical protein